MKLGLKGQFPSFLSGPTTKSETEDEASFGDADLMELGLSDGNDVRQLETAVARLESDERAIMSEMVSMRREISEMNEVVRDILSAIPSDVEEDASSIDAVTPDDGRMEGPVDADYYEEGLEQDAASVEGSRPPEPSSDVQYVEEEMPLTSSKEGSHSLMQVQRMLEYELDRVFVKRISGARADEGDIAQVERLFALFCDLVR